MRRNLCKGTALALALLFLVLSQSAMAAEPKTVVISVRVTAEGTLPSPEEQYQIRLTANDADNPMPNGLTGGSTALYLVGPIEGAFPQMVYSRVGIYTYTVELVPGTYPDCVYDSRVYTVKVTVTNAEGGGLDVTVALQESGKEEKPAEVEFHNRYRVIPKPTTPPGSITPTGVNDTWPYYLIGCAALLCVAGFLLAKLFRKEDD